MSDDRRRSVSLDAPERRGIQDPGAHELTSDSDDHFSDAQSARAETPAAPASPLPKLRVEKVDDEPSYGEVPGTEAYEKRTGDATPDEIAIIPDSNTDAEPTSPAEPHTPGGQPIPKTVVDETVDAPGSKTHHFNQDVHKADAAPDYVRKPDGTGEANPVPASLETTGQAPDAAPLSPSLKSPTKHRRKSSAARSTDGALSQGSNEVDDGEDDFGGDDFDEFEEGDEDADFDDFDDGFQEAEAETPAPTQVAAPPSVSTPSFPILDLDGLDSEDILAATEPYLDALFPPDLADLPILPSPPMENPIFFNPRSASLWSQLAAPPPLQPPDWIRSRIRRLFLVSLGVPVDLDEILPASKQKKLVLPSLHRVTSNGSLRASSESRSVSRLRKEGTNDSTASLDSQGKEKPRSPSKRRKGPAPEPALDLVAAKQFCTTTDEALGGMTDEELRTHVNKLEEMENLAKDVLEYWKKKTDEKIGDREAFEGVIENLVKHARKTRK
ncbi:hypothetical protein BKA67DRAFT_661490 [Truncatella angustata]|uniref:Uncharacterized protein n=1 Tax=Truncatella angustata TaxID=152316 RepID=A0A9P8UEK4_9PEZI|nr:uncharacterized protein BKA67DRAFT_661490 [Truncatella angustata]KAH6648523.1 hypothetical protein BKA67DRAFT_661490 [Truncatella angustata]KAH8196795.1 hypothetical protein TruAng_009037 [Truncatella angustata]